MTSWDQADKILQTDENILITRYDTKRFLDHVEEANSFLSQITCNGQAEQSLIGLQQTDMGSAEEHTLQPESADIIRAARPAGQDTQPGPQGQGTRSAFAESETYIFRN